MLHLRYIWNSHPWVQKQVAEMQAGSERRRLADPSPPSAPPAGPRAVTTDLVSNDAFHTVIQWLYGKLVRRLQQADPSVQAADV
jgi:hypothetical protein